MIEFHETVGLCCCILVPWTYVMSETAIEPPSQRREAFKTTWGQILNYELSLGQYA
jgi:hypothetical protein